MRRILSILTTLLLSLTAVAQRYSVTVTPVLLPPYTLNLSELTAQGSAKMMTTITVNDLTARNLPVRLHFKLESAGITIENIPTSAVAPLFLNGGETQILTGADMAQYLRLDNLEFRGYSKESYRQTGQLPGGLWKVTVEVRHFHTGRSLSNRGTATVWVSIYDPPVLTAPRNGTEAPDNPSLPLVFSWQASKHTGGTVAVQYKLELWEMRMDGVPAQTVAASMTPIFETTTQVTSYTAIPTGMNLEPGMRYCWRVTVSDPSGQAQINKNGQSEVREFTYLHTCPPVDEVTAAVRNTQADFSWTPSPYHTHFRVEMLQEGGSSDVSDCYDSKFRLYDFPQGTTWRVRVRGECKGDLEADWSPWTDFSIDPPGTPPTNDECPDCGCDDGPAKREIENYELKELQPGDTIVNRTGRTRFIVLSANATGEGVYSGQFYLWLELWKTKVRCDYTDLKVNTDGVILDGSWRSVHNDGLMVNPATVAENIQNIRNGIANATFDNSISDTIKLGYAIQTIYKDENGRYIAILEDGSEHDLTQDLSTANKTMVEDSQGNKMVVTGDQQLMSAEQYHNTGKNNTLIKSDNERKDRQIAASGDVIFKPSGNQQYGFDAYDASTNNHPEIYPPLEGGSYRPAYKSVAQWQQDKVAADPMQGVTFRNNMGAPYATISGDIILRGEPQPGETPVYAHVAETDSTTKVVGKLNLLTFEPREISVCLVPVNGATPPNAQTLEKELNKIFKPAVASVKLSTATPINIQYANGENFVHGGSGLLSVYSNDEKNAIKALQNADNDTYYLFVVDNATRLNPDGTQMKDILAGYMPIGYQCGFLFGSPAAKYVAHELGHGAFGLHHTFSSETESFSAPQYSTNNLMDYADGATLNHKQWRWMHEKHGSGLFGFLADESEGEGKKKNIDLTNATIVGYIIKDDKAFERENISPYKSIATSILAKGTEVELIDYVDSKKEIASIIYKNLNKVTMFSNLEPIYELKNKLKYKLIKDCESVDIAYSDNKTEITHKKNTYCYANKACGKYVQIKEDVKGNNGWWVPLECLQRVGNDTDDDFNWMKNIMIDDGTTISEEIISSINNNRNQINDRTDKYIYTSTLHEYKKGMTYTNRSVEGKPTGFTGTEFEKEVKQKIYEELCKEGSFGSINTYDAEHFTWGKGFSAKGELLQLLNKLFEMDMYKQLFKNVGIIIVDNHLWVLDAEGTWRKDAKGVFEASDYIASNNQLLSFFIELAEKSAYSQDVINAQANTFFESGAGNYPDYILNAEKTAYNDNWNHSIVTLLCHLSHWTTGSGWQTKGVSYENTKGEWKKVLYEYIYNTAKNTGKKIDDNVYQWSSKYKLLDRLNDFGCEKPIGRTKLYEFWTSVKLDIKNDEKGDEHAVNIDNNSYITNANCVIIKDGDSYIVITEDAELIKYEKFE